MSKAAQTKRPLDEVPRYLLNRREAAESLGMSLRHFERHVQTDLPCVYVGQLRFYRPIDIERWRDNACRQGSPA